MAEKEVKVTKDVKQPNTDKIESEKVTQTSPTVGGTTVGHHPLSSPYFWLIISSAVLLALIIAGIVAAAIRHHEMEQQANRPGYGWSSLVTGSGPFGGRTHGYYWSTTSSQDGPTTTTTVTNYTYTSGVVTKVSGDSLTVAGNGKAETIKTNSSTQYIGDTKPAVNDSVTIVGTADSKGTITATQIRVNND